MTDKEQSQPQFLLTGCYPVSQIQRPESDEISLFDLIAYLWGKKTWIVSGMLVSMLIAGIYSFMVKEQWTATAVVDVPTFNSINNYYQGVRLIEGEVDKPTNSDEVSGRLFRQFISQISSYNELDKFIRQSEYFKAISVGKNEEETLDLLNKMISKVTVVKDKDNFIFNINFPSNNASRAQRMLEDYINVANSNISKIQYMELASQIELKKSSILNQMEALKKNASDQRIDKLQNIKMALTVAEKANIDKLDLKGFSRIDDSSLFLLGKSTLSAMIEGIEKQPLVLDDEYYRLQSRLISLDKFKVDDSTAKAFSYLKSPFKPINKDQPKVFLIIFLGAVLGFMLSCFSIILIRSVGIYKASHQ